MEKIVDVPDLGGSMPFESDPRVRLAHSATVVYHLYQRLTRLLDKQPDLCSACIYSILQQFFDGAGGSLDHFSGRYLVG